MYSGICAAPGCGNEFVRNPSNKRYCSLTCKRAAESFKRSYYVEDENFSAFSDQEAIRSSERFSQDEEDPEKTTFVRSENRRLNTLVNKHKNMAEEILDQIYSAVSDNIRHIKVPAPSPYTFTTAYGEELVCNVINSDTQIGKKTPTYDHMVAKERVAKYTETVIERTNMLRQTHPITDCHVWFLGDIVEGESIFPSQPWLLSSSLYEQVAKNGPEMYGDQLRRLLEEFDRVHVVGVIGNHGSLGRFNNPESNMDRVLYKILQLMFAYEPRITFDIPDGYGETMFWAVDQIGSYSALLMHGDQLPAPTSAGSYRAKVLGWKSGAIETHFDDVYLGHWHQNVKMTINQTVVRICGSTESTNTFAQEKLAAVGRPSQHLQFISKDNGVQWESDIYLD